MVLRFPGTDAKRDSFVYRQVAVGIITMVHANLQRGPDQSIASTSVIIQGVLRLTSY